VSSPNHYRGNTKVHRLLVLLYVAVACAHRSETLSTGFRSADQAVYQTVVDSIFAPWVSSGIRQLVIRNHTSVHRGGSAAFRAFSQLPGFDTVAMRDFEARASEAHSLAGIRSLRVRIPIVLVDDQTLDSFSKGLDKYWSEFYQRYPGSSGLISLSPVGYNSKADFAILMVYQECGVVCGNGYAIALRRQGETWRIVAMDGTPVS
jgi:hypothetical protein